MLLICERYGLTTESGKAAFLCDAWTGTFATSRGEDLRRPVVSETLRQVLENTSILYHTAGTDFRGAMCESVKAAGQRFTRITMWCHLDFNRAAGHRMANL